MPSFSLFNKQSPGLYVGVLCMMLVVGCTRIPQRSDNGPQSPPSTLAIGVISDIHHCTGEERELQPFIETVNNTPTDFNINLGDLVNARVRKCSDTFTQDLDWGMKHLTTNAPLHWIIGDHDLIQESSYRQWEDFLRREKNYYSFDQSDFHIIILDTVLGGDTMRSDCPNDPECAPLLAAAEEFKQLKQNPAKLADYLAQQHMTDQQFLETYAERKNRLASAETILKQTRSTAQRDTGRIGQFQLDWLKADIAATAKQRVVIFSDHPLFPLQTEKKSYAVVGAPSVREILERSNKQIVCISGEAHVWHEAMSNGIQYYIIDAYSKPEHPFAIFRWDDAGYRLEKIPDP